LTQINQLPLTLNFIMKQSTRIVIAYDTLEILDKGSYTNDRNEVITISDMQEKAVRNTRLYRPEELDELLQKDVAATQQETVFEVTNETTLDAARRLAGAGEADVLVLNFASAKNAGGGFLGGASAQEESIARASGLYPCLLQAKEYYEFHRRQDTCLYSDYMIYSPAVPVLKDEEGRLLDKPVPVSVVTSPAANAGAIKNNEPENEHLILPVMKLRTDKLLALCAAHKHEVLVLGAWGCGVFRNDPEMIAQLFYEALNGRFKNVFRKVVFAVKTNTEAIIAPFEKYFG
jgi:uncharacterized protein (TIGR02452 family)